MKYLLLAFVLINTSFAGLVNAQQRPEAPFELSGKLAELNSLPVGLVVSHNPEPVHATLYSPSLSGVQWKHNTTVTATESPVSLIEYGYFVKRNGQWEFSYGTQVPLSYDSKDFAIMFACPDAKLKPGESYTNLENRSVIDCVPEQMVKWFFIGLDDKGNRVKGEATLNLLAEVIE